jgi:putative ABC transport system ATP-binding protein
MGMLSVEAVRKTFNKGTVNEKIALCGVSFELKEGDFVTVVGGNGSGKTTMLNAVAGVFPVDSGSIRIHGKNITALPEHKRAAYIGRVFQDPMIGSASNMTIEENLAISYRRGYPRGLKWGIEKQERKSYKEALRQLDLGLENRMGAKVGLLSGGQRQALTLLMATIRRPALLLLDEHTAALDPKTAAKVLELSDRFIRQDGLTALMVTHNMHDAIHYGNRMIVMQDGQIAHEAYGKEKFKLTVTDVVGLMNRFMALG